MSDSRGSRDEEEKQASGRWRRRYVLGGGARQMEEEAHSGSMNSMPRPKFPLLENLEISWFSISNVARGEMTTRSYVYKKKM